MAQSPSRTSRRRAPLKRAAASTIEMLEIRRMLSTVVNKDHSGDNDGLPDIFITGTSGTDRITVYLDPLHDFAAVFDDKNGNNQVNSGELTSGGMPETLDISTSGGTDTVSVQLLSDLAGSLHQPTVNLVKSTGKAGANSIAAAGVIPNEYYGEGVSIYVDLGSGNDKFEIKSPTQPLSSNIHSALTKAAGFDVNADPDGADIIEGGDLVVEVDGGNDKDSITFDFSRTSVISSSLIATTDAGSGDDIVTLTLPDFKGDGSGDIETPQEGIVGSFQYYSETTGAVSVQGITPYYGEGLTPSNVSIAIDLGSGKNTLTINTNTLVSASDVHIDVSGGKDTDTVTDNESIIATSFVVTLNEDASTAEFSELPGRYVLDVDLGSGNDSYFQNADYTTLQEQQQQQTISAQSFFIDFNGDVSYNVHGGSGKDSVQVFDAESDLGPEGNTAEVAGLLEYNLYGGDDDDNVRFDTNPGSQFALEGGELKVLVSGDGGNDFGRIDLALVPDFSIPEQPLLDPAILTLSGGSGNDKLGMMVQVVGLPPAVNRISAAGVLPILPPGFFGPRGYPLLDGGSGSDKYDTEGNVNFVTRGAETLDESIEPAYIP